MTDTSKIYIQLSKELAEIDKDLTTGLASVGYMNKANKESIKELQNRIAYVEQQLKQAEVIQAALRVRLDKLEDKDKEHTGKIRTIEIQDAKKDTEVYKISRDDMKTRLSFWGPIVVAIATGLISIIMQLIEAK